MAKTRNQHKAESIQGVVDAAMEVIGCHDGCFCEETQREVAKSKTLLELLLRDIGRHLSVRDCVKLEATFNLVLSHTGSYWTETDGPSLDRWADICGKSRGDFSAKR